MSPDITAFFDDATNTISYVVRDPAGSACAIIDSVLDFDYSSGRTDTASADRIIAHVTAEGLDVPEAGDDPSEWDHAAHGHAGMAGLLTPEEMAALIRAEGTDFDRLFLEGMIRHHDGAVQMATEGMPESTNARVLELMEEVATGQLAEIARMERLLDQLPA